MRLDQYLVREGYAESRQKARYLLEAGAVFLDGKLCDKAAAPVDGKTVAVRGEGLRYVSRGGLKLEGALDLFRFDPRGMTAVDVGASTGGFTDCLLQRGCAKVYALDVGDGQLHPRLRQDPRVCSIEHFNGRNLSETTLPEKCGLAVMDLSFISQRLLYAPLTAVLTENAWLLSLIKPQFEAGERKVGKHGIVRDPLVRLRVLRELTQAASQSGFSCFGLAESCIRGGDGNREYTALFRWDGGGLPLPEEDTLRQAVFFGGCCLRGEDGSFHLKMPSGARENEK